MTWLLLMAIGVFAGMCSGLFGIGGGIVLVPSLVFFMKFSPHAANGTSLSAMLLPVGALGVWQYYQAGKIGLENLKFGAWIALGMFCGAFFGARIAVALQSQWLQRIFAGLLIFAAGRLLIQSFEK